MENRVKRIVREYNVRVWTTLLYFRKGKSISLLLSREWTLIFHIERGNF